MRASPVWPGRSVADDARALLYVGPKDHQVLGRARPRPASTWCRSATGSGPSWSSLMDLLRWVHGHVGNYGWSIVALTVLINLVMAPLRHYSIANGIKMAKLSPEMRVIQERYRKVPALDPQRQEMQKEVAALYARHGMSMSTQMTGGLPAPAPHHALPDRRSTACSRSRSSCAGAVFLWIPDLAQRDPLLRHARCSWARRCS